MANNWAQLIRAYAPQYGVDPAAALAVASVEGLSGAVGDNGTSFGPFQLHIGGANPYSNPSQARSFAESPAGIKYALAKMAAAGARGKKGQAAVESIVRNFERPADPSGEIARALGHYGAGSSNGRTPDFGSGYLGSNPSPAASISAPAMPNVQNALLSWVMAQNNAFATGQPTSASLPQFLSLFSSQAPSTRPLGGSVTAPNATPPSVKGQTTPASLASLDGFQVDARVLPQVENVLKKWGVKISSGYRSPSHNAAVGGAENSDHLRGDAVDFVGTPAQMAALYKWAQGRFPYVEPMAQAKNHVHISFLR